MVNVTRRRSLVYLVLALLVAVYCYWALTKPLPLLKPDPAVTELQISSPPGKLVWPREQSAVGLLNSSVLQTNGPQVSVPTASTAKIINALTVLHARPLKPGQPGPIIQLGPNDATLYNFYAARGGSAVPVAVGEKISEYQMLQTMMLPSANNMADSLAIWAYGSLQNYTKAASAYLEQLGLAATHIGSDASGFAPTTTSNAHDLVKLGELAMKNPVLAQIVGQPVANGIPLVGSIKNVNFLLGTSGIIGIKTGNSDQAGGVYLAAAKTTVNGRPVTIVTALTHAPTLFASMKDSLPLVQSAEANFSLETVTNAGAVVGHYKLPWGGTIAAVTTKKLDVMAWNGSQLPVTVTLKPISSSADVDTVAGNLSTAKTTISNSQSVPIRLQSFPPSPTLLWRLLHP